MRVRVVRCPDLISSLVNLTIQSWFAGQWKFVMNVPMHESERANEIAMKLSLTKRVPVEMAVFEDGEKLELSRGVDVLNRQYVTKLPDIGESIPLERVECGPAELAYLQKPSENP